MTFPSLPHRSPRGHFKLWPVCASLCVCVWYAESDCLRSVPLLNTRTHCDRYVCKEDVEIWDCYRDPDVYVPPICLNFSHLLLLRCGEASTHCKVAETFYMQLNTQSLWSYILLLFAKIFHACKWKIKVHLTHDKECDLQMIVKQHLRAMGDCILLQCKSPVCNFWSFRFWSDYVGYSFAHASPLTQILWYSAR